MSRLAELHAEARRQHPEESDAQIAERVAYRVATMTRPHKLSHRSWSMVSVAWSVLKVLWAAAILALLGAIALKAQDRPENTVRPEKLLASLKAYPPPAFDAPILFLSNQGTQLAVIPAGKVILNCSTNLSCTWNSGTRQFDLTSSATAGTAWSSLTAPTVNLAMAHAAFTTTFTWGAATGAGVDLFNLVDTTGNTGTGHLFAVNTVGTSAAKPIRFTAGGTANGVEMDTTGQLGAIGTGNINATKCSGATCAAFPVVLSNTAQATPPGVSGQLLFNNAGAVGAEDPIVSGAVASASDTLTVAGFSTAVSLSGGAGAVMRLTFGGTITALDVRAQVSSDGGTNFQDVDTYNISSEVVQLSISSATAADYSLYVPAGATHVRANVVTLTGTTPSITIAVRTSYLANPRTHTAFDRVPGSSDPSHIVGLGASDGTNIQRLRAATAAPAGTEQGLITRNIPSGTQTVSGTVTSNIGTTGGLALDATVSAVQPRRIQDGAGATLATVTAANALKVDGSAVTQPVSGTITANAGTGTFNIQANASVNEAQVNGVALGSPSAYGTSPGAVNVPGVNAFITNTPAVTLASTSANQGTAAALSGAWPAKVTDGTNTLPAGDAAARAIFFKQTDGTNVYAVDPCSNSANTRNSANINQAAGAQLITGVAAKQTYICSLNLITATAQNIALVEGTGTVCATGIAGMAGGSTAATGWNLSANGGLVSNGGGYWVFNTATAADNVCLLQSGTGQVSGNVSYVQQ